MTHEEIQQAARNAGQRIAPLWPLQDFVAVNPFLGLADRSFAESAETMRRMAGARVTMPRSFYRTAIADGRISRDDLVQALAEMPAGDARPPSTAALLTAIETDPVEDAAPVATIAEIAADLSGIDWPTIIVERVSFWAADHFDRGQAKWRLPTADLPPYQSWRQTAQIDRTPEIAGLRGFCRLVRELPSTAAEMITFSARQLDLPQAALDAYFHRLLLTIGGWAAFARQQAWERNLRGITDDGVIDVLAIRLAWEIALFRQYQTDPGFTRHWQAARRSLTAPITVSHDTAIDCTLQLAYEMAWLRRQLPELLGAATRPPAVRPETRKALHAVFCIDTRSEVFRRALESQSSEIASSGFAGFFGLPIAVASSDDAAGGSHCPVLLAPAFTVRNSADASDKKGIWGRLAASLSQPGLQYFWQTLKQGAISSFAFVETLGPLYGAKLIGNSLFSNRSAVSPGDAAPTARAFLDQDFGLSAIPPAARLDLAEGILKAMSLTTSFARLVLLVGHGATSVNNPHASGLDCGACGGHRGDVNARLAAALFNDAEVRQGLRSRGLEIPDDTLFLGALHDTTTDQIQLFDRLPLSPGQRHDLQQVAVWLTAAGKLTRAERAPRLALDPRHSVDGKIFARSRDWGQIRPEWGLANCAAFIAAPRDRTASLNLNGRAFLHSYDWQADPEAKVLELIMTAPMVVASWINLQYYGSAVDNDAFGSGNKLLHNIVGGIGVQEGNGGDLRVGLPRQSLHDGQRLLHEPMRLAVFIEAPIAAIQGVLDKHAALRQLLDNGWLRLHALDQDGGAARYVGQAKWARYRPAGPAIAA
jgi:hypothetical protein